MTTVTRFNTTTRPANEAEGLDERDVVRFFDGRKLVGEFDIEDISRDDWEAGLLNFINNTKSGDPRKTPVTLEAVMDWMGEDEGENGDEEDEAPGSIVPEKYRILYGAEQNCGDDIAVALTDFVTQPRASRKDTDGGLDRAKLRAVAEVNGLADRLAIWEDRGLNGGLLRMNTSNVLRGMHRRGEEVTIGSATWPAREVEKKVRARKTPAKTA
jgi:hypothetical protein